MHLIKVDDLSHEFLGKIFATAKEYKYRRKASRQLWNELHGRLHNHLMISDFFEPSTRTRFSFEAAMSYLGGNVIGSENAAEFSSFKKGESIHDNFKVIGGYGDIIVGRFLNEGEAQIAADVSMIPVINGGDGKGEHPTQALIDLFSIIEKFPDPDNLRITFVGDNLHSRTVRSLTRLLVRFPCVREMTFLGPEGQNVTQTDTDVLYDLSGGYNHNIHIWWHGRQFDAEQMARTDVLYMTRSQVERHSTFPGTSVLDVTISPDFYLTPELADALPTNAVILHPLPRNAELPRSIDDNPRAYYFEQAWNGLYIRMALLEEICLN
jgi:aspartate carbamoyltransferase catalytic subunit